ncbi:NADH-quinone oxidoreductase subunit D [Labeo rohita]|uniref:NADH-quinone oxidoreductase subunit D n=1 Tax=Labeo rohita TaxID=84645 RepID=A0ABQ8LAN2_LABRO|nr:NADH-quinone oxidoreductase subunit D [Labeo rohita]
MSNRITCVTYRHALANLQNNQLEVNQSGFKNRYLTKTALLSVTEALRIKKADSKSSVLIPLDLTAAFDTVNHQILLSVFSSQRFHFAGLNPVSQVGLSGWPGGEGYPKHISWPLGFLRDQFSDPSSSPYTLHHWGPSYRHMGSTTAMLMAHSSIFRFNQTFQKYLHKSQAGMDDRTAPTARPGSE